MVAYQRPVPNEFVGAWHALARWNYINRIWVVWIPGPVRVVNAVWRIGIAVLTIRIRHRIRFIRIVAQTTPVLALAVVQARRVGRIWICMGLIAVWASVRAVRIHEAIGFIGAASPIWVVETARIVWAVLRRCGSSQSHEKRETERFPDSHGRSFGPQSLETVGKANPNVAMQAVTFIIKTTF